MISIPGEIIEEIVLRLPVKSILRFRSVSKPWLSRISHPSFTKLHLTRAHRTAFFISAYDYSSHKRHLFCAAHDGGPVTHLLTLGHEYFDGYAKAQHLNGLVLFTCVLVNTDHAFVINPSTRKIYKLPDPTFGRLGKFYVFGFDESINEHKILLIRKHVKYLNKVEIMIFSLSNYSWRIINAQPPGPDVALSCYPFHYGTECSVCVNSVVHLTLDTSDILAFDLRTEKVSIITTPQGVAPYSPDTVHTRNGQTFIKDSKPSIIKINGCVGFVCHDRVMERNELHIWILQDYENRVWVKEIITFPQPWIGLGCTFPLDVYKDEIIFTPSRLSRKHSAPIYNKKSRCLKSVRFTFGDEIIKCSKTVQFDQIKCYVESMTPL